MICLGTRQTTSNDAQSQQEAMVVAVFVDQTTLRVIVTSSKKSSAFETRIDIREVKGLEQDERAAETVASWIIKPEQDAPKKQPQILLSTEDQTLAMRQTTPSGLVRVLWSGTLQEIDFYTAFSLLANSWNHQQTAKSKAQDQHRETQKRLEQAHASVRKLDSAVQSQKDELLDNFLTLYNDQKKRLRQAQDSLEEYKKRVKNKPKAPAPPVFAARDSDTEEEAPVDLERYSDDLVDRLAAGRPSTKTARVKRVRIQSPAGPQSPVALSPPPPTRNPIMGGIELWSVNDLFKQEDGEGGDEVEKRPEAKRKEPTSVKTEPQANDSSMEPELDAGDVKAAAKESTSAEREEEEFDSDADIIPPVKRARKEDY